MATVTGAACLNTGSDRFPVPGHGGMAGLAILRAIFRRHGWPILLTYTLFMLENTFATAQPFALGLAIDGLIDRSYYNLAMFMGLQVIHLLIGVSRRTYDTRMFGHIHAELVSQLVVDQHRRQIELTRIAARSSLSHEFVDFFEQYVPIAIRIIFSMIGGLAILATYDRPTVLLCIALVVPAGFLNIAYSRRTLAYSGELHDALEHEVDVIRGGHPDEIRGHYAAVTQCQVRLSDSEAFNFGAMELFVLALIAVSLVRSCGSGPATPGEILAMLRYVHMFIGGLDGLPILIQKTSRLRDISRRCAADASAGRSEMTSTGNGLPG